MNSIKFSIPAMVDFILKSAEIYNYFYNDQMEITETFLHGTKQ